MFVPLDDAVARDLGAAARLAHRKSLPLLAGRLAAGEGVALLTTGIVDRRRRPVLVLVALTDSRVLVAGAQLRTSYVRSLAYRDILDVSSHRDLLKRGRPLELHTATDRFKLQVTGRKDLDVRIRELAGLATTATR
jgi:hypothetical protein